MNRIIKLLRRAPKKNKPRNRLAIYDICVVKKGSHGKAVYEKLGTYSMQSNSFSLNIFRLAFWISKNVSFTGNSMKLLTNHNIFRFVEKPKKINEIRR